MLTTKQMEEVRSRLALELLFYVSEKQFPVAQEITFPILLEFTRLVDFRNLDIPPEQIKITDLIFEDRLPSVFASFVARRFSEGNKQAALSVTGIIIPDQKIIVPDRKVAEGVLIRGNSAVWYDIIAKLQSDWSQAYSLSSTRWEEIVAAAFDKAGFDEVTLTPRSGDRGRDVIAVRKGVGSIKIIGSVKAYKPGHNVSYDDVRALLGVLSGERDASKGIITTTSNFPPRILEDPFIAPFLPTRLELMNGDSLQRWLGDLLKK